MAVGLGFVLGRSSSSLERERSLILGEFFGVGSLVLGDRERSRGVRGTVSSGDLSLICLSEGSPLFGKTSGEGALLTGIGKSGLPIGNCLLGGGGIRGFGPIDFVGGGKGPAPIIGKPFGGGTGAAGIVKVLKFGNGGHIGA